MMRRIYDDFAYGAGVREGCWWDETCNIKANQVIAGDHTADVAIIGAGFTGLNAALRLAELGANVVVLEAETVGWGASGRNGGFCCLGGSKSSDAKLDRRFGRDGRLEYRAAEVAAIAHVEKFLTQRNLDVDRHSNGEMMLAHRPKDERGLDEDARAAEENFGVECRVLSKSQLQTEGMNGPFHGGMSIPLGFALNPRKYIKGLLDAVLSLGVEVYEQSPAVSFTRSGSRYTLDCNTGRVHAAQVIIATNGYSSENFPPWLASRYMPTQSNVLVTRPLTDDELAAAGWQSEQMSYDTRDMVHYFRLMPDRRFLFGMRGGVMTGAGAEARARTALRNHFDEMFPAWRSVEARNMWSGMVCIARDLMPFAGPVPDMPGFWAGLCYHGNGVAMGSYTGGLLGDLVAGQEPKLHPQAMQKPLSRFPFGRFRRVLMPAVYASRIIADR